MANKRNYQKELDAKKLRISFRIWKTQTKVF